MSGYFELPLSIITATSDDIEETKLVRNRNINFNLSNTGYIMFLVLRDNQYYILKRHLDIQMIQVFDLDLKRLNATTIPVDETTAMDVFDNKIYMIRGKGDLVYLDLNNIEYEIKTLYTLFNINYYFVNLNIVNKDTFVITGTQTILISKRKRINFPVMTSKYIGDDKTILGIDNQTIYIYDLNGNQIREIAVDYSLYHPSIFVDTNYIVIHYEKGITKINRRGPNKIKHYLFKTNILTYNKGIFIENTGVYISIYDSDIQLIKKFTVSHLLLIMGITLTDTYKIMVRTSSKLLVYSFDGKLLNTLTNISHDQFLYLTNRTQKEDYANMLHKLRSNLLFIRSPNITNLIAKFL